MIQQNGVEAKKTNPIKVLIYARTFNNNPQWLLPCTCGQRRCHGDVRFKLDILCIKRFPHQSTPLLNPTNTLTIQFIDFTCTIDKFLQETINKIQIYQPLRPSITKGGKLTHS